MKRQIMLLLTASGMVVMLNACSSSNAENTGKTMGEEDEITWPAVKIEKASPTRELHLPGELTSYFETDIYPKVNSYIKKINVDIGDHVAEGQLLAELEAPELKSQLAEAYAKVKSAEAQWTAGKSTYRRILKAAQTPGAVSPYDLDVARSKTVADSLSLSGANAVYQSMQEMNGFLKVRSPFAGIITDRKLSPGAFVGPGEKTAVPVFKIKQEHKLRLQIAVPEKYLDAVRQNQPVSFTVMSFPDEVFKGKVNRISHNVEKQSRSEMIEIEIPNNSLRLVSGMYAMVNLPVERSGASLMVPSSAIATTMEKCFVVKVVDGKAQWVDVKKGMEADGKTEVFGQVKEGDIILKTASDEVKTGMSLKLVNTNY